MADILIVDDNSQAVELIEHLLGEIGYTSVACEDTLQASALVEQYRPHILLVNLTVADERDICSLLESIQQIDPDTVCVAVPRSDQVATQVEYASSPLDDYIEQFQVYRVGHTRRGWMQEQDVQRINSH